VTNIAGSSFDDVWHERAQRILIALDRALLDHKRGLFIARKGFFRRYEALWPYVNAWHATIALAACGDPLTTRLQWFSRGLHAYEARANCSGKVAFHSRAGGRVHPAGEIFFDDNAWVALALMRHHEIDNDPNLVSLAEGVLSFLLTGWSGDASWAVPGGIRWRQSSASTTRNTCSNAPIAHAAAWLFQVTGAPRWLEWSRRIYRWTREALLTKDGLYADHVHPTGTRDASVWSYNQGSMIGAATYLYQVTGEWQYLEDARSLRAAALSRFTLEQLMREVAAFPAIYFRNLVELDALDAEPAVWLALRRYADALWQVRHLPDGLFSGASGSILNDTAPVAETFACLART
jgi:hypothetical protein